MRKFIFIAILLFSYEAAACSKLVNSNKHQKFTLKNLDKNGDNLIDFDEYSYGKDLPKKFLKSRWEQEISKGKSKLTAKEYLYGMYCPLEIKK